MDTHNQQAFLEVNNLSYTYLTLEGREVNALANVSLTLNAGNILTIIGPSRSGKSTFLRLINRLQEVSYTGKLSGEIKIQGKNIYHPDVDQYQLRREIGFVFDKPQVLNLSVYENIVFGPRLLGISNKNQLDEIVETTLKSAFLWDEVKDRLNINAWQLSGGQKQRLSIARSLALKPKMLLLDEPCSALDPVSTAKIEEALVSMKSETTIILVTNNTKQASRIGDITAFFLLSKLVEIGPTDQIFKCPKEKVTNDYISGRFG